MEKMKIINILILLLVITAIGVVFALSPPPRYERSSNPAVVVMRVDDIQDYAFKKGQLFLLNHSQQNNYPLSLAVIPYYFGQDSQLFVEIERSINSGSEIAAHGFMHENFSLCSYDEQKMLLMQAKQTLGDVLNLDVNVLVPPMFSYNNDTVNAMEETGYSIVSGLFEFHKYQWISQGVQSIPATIELCDFYNNRWIIKDTAVLLSELESSIQNYGYAIIVTHPQEFMVGLELNLESTKKYEELITEIVKEYGFCTIENLVAATRS